MSDRFMDCGERRRRTPAAEPPEVKVEPFPDNGPVFPRFQVTRGGLPVAFCFSEFDADQIATALRTLLGCSDCDGSGNVFLPPGTWDVCPACNSGEHLT